MGLALSRMGAGLPQVAIQSRSQHVGDALTAAGLADAAVPILVATTNDALPKASCLAAVPSLAWSECPVLIVYHNSLPRLCKHASRARPCAATAGHCRVPTRTPPRPRLLPKRHAAAAARPARPGQQHRRPAVPQRSSRWQLHRWAPDGRVRQVRAAAWGCCDAALL